MRFGGIVLVIVVTLGACSSDPEPKEPAATATTAPTRPVPTMPAQASEDSPEGAAAFVKHYVDVFNYAAATGDVEELTRLSSPNCEGCQSYITLYRDTYQAGGYFKGSDWTIGDLELEVAGSEVNVYTKVESNAGVRRDRRGQSEVPGDAENAQIVFTVDRTDPNRHVTRFERSIS